MFIGQIPKFSCFKALPDASDAHLHPHAGVPLARHSASAWDTSGAQGRGECGGSGAPCATLSRSEEERRGDFKWGLSVASLGFNIDLLRVKDVLMGLMWFYEAWWGFWWRFDADLWLTSTTSMLSLSQTQCANQGAILVRTIRLRTTNVFPCCGQSQPGMHPCPDKGRPGPKPTGQECCQFSGRLGSPVQAAERKRKMPQSALHAGAFASTKGGHLVVMQQRGLGTWTG